MLDKIDFDIDTKVMKDIDDDIKLFNINLNEVDNIKIPNLDKIVKSKYVTKKNIAHRIKNMDAAEMNVNLRLN